MTPELETLDRLSAVHLPPPLAPDQVFTKLALALTTLQAAAAEVHPEPSEAQKEYGNYKKGHVSWKGLGLTIESAKGQYRRGVTKDGTPWKTKMTAHYGYIKRTRSEADGDHIDIFLCDDDLDSEIVFIVDQVDPSTGKFDEHKIVLGVTNAAAAKALYLSNYQAGWQGFSAVTPLTLGDFKEWLDAGDSSRPFAGSSPKSRFNKNAGVQDLAGNEDAVLCPHGYQLQAVRGEGYPGLQKMANELREFLRGHGSEAARNDVGASQQTEKLQSVELLLGHTKNAGTESIEQSEFDVQGRNATRCSLGREARHLSGHVVAASKPPLAVVAGVDGDADTSGEAYAEKQSSDLVDTYVLNLMEKRAKLLPTTHLRPHQEEIAETGKQDHARLLLYHSLGSGKSLSSLSAAETAGEPYTAVTPASLRPNYRKEQEKFTDETTPNNLVSYNAVAKGSVEPTPTLIFDEAQRLRNPESATTQHATELADQAKRVYLLSGTPIVNHPHELAPMIRMLTGRQFSPEEFDKKFVDERKISPGLMGWIRGVRPVQAPQMKNKEEFDDLMRGHVHYYAPEKPNVETKEEHVVTDMGPEQVKLYKSFWNQLPWLYRWKLQNSFPLTRQEMTRLSSFLSGPRQVGLSTYPFMRGKGNALKAFDQSPKLQAAHKALMEELRSNPDARGVAFSNFIDAGLSPYAAALDRDKIPYGIFHGGLNDAARKKVVDDYNNNRIRALLLGPSGGEGISLKGTRLLQILDPHWNSARTDQAVGRGIRYDSHSYLPVQDRNVRVQRFVSQLPPSTWSHLWRSLIGRKHDDDPRRTSPGVDTYLEGLASRKDSLNDQFLAELQRIGLEGRMNKAGADEMADALRKKMEEAERPFTIAVDLDGTLAEQLHPHDPERIGDLRPKVKAWMDKFQAAGARIIIFTVRGDDDLVADWLEENDIPYDYINENPDQPLDSSGKVIADLYLDDRAVDASGDWDDHGELVLQRVKSAFTVGSVDDDLLDAVLAEFTHDRRAQHSTADMAG